MGAIRPSLLDFPGRDPINDGAGIVHHSVMRNTGARIVQGFLHLQSKPGVMLPHLALALDEIAHELTYELRSWPVGRLGLAMKASRSSASNLRVKTASLATAHSHGNDDECIMSLPENPKQSEK
jgi:hypothetical protein